MYYNNFNDELSPSIILHRITTTDLREADSYTYVICGRSGPTGKTWLCEGIKHLGYNAIELSEDLIGLVDYRDDKNHFIVNEQDKFILIVLNKLLKR